MKVFTFAVAILLLAGLTVATWLPVHAQEQNQKQDDRAETDALELEFPQVFDALNFTRPLYLLAPPDDSDLLYVLEQAGRIVAFENDPEVKEYKVVWDFTRRVFSPANGGFNEEGLLGMAFHPDYASNRKVYLHYSIRQPRGNIISQWLMQDDGTLDPQSEKILMRVPQPYSNHNGGMLLFGPDGYLYITLGDGGAANDPQNRSQNLGNLFGTILRIDVDNVPEDKPYGIPADNPFVDVPDARPEIYAYGLRNVWRMSFDRETGDLWAGDVGQDLWEEIDLIEKGGNYGWNYMEGNHRFRARPGGLPSEMPEDLIAPIVEHNHAVAKSITGGYVYRGRVSPALVGKYFYADYFTGFIWIIEYDTKEKRLVHEPLLVGKLEEIASFGEDRKGELYIVSLRGRIYHVKTK